MRELQEYNKEHQHERIDPEYTAMAIFDCDYDLLVMDYYIDGLSNNADAAYFDPEQATKFLMEFIEGQASARSMYERAVWTNKYLEELVALLQKGYECTPHIMLRLVNQYDKVLRLLNEQKQKTEEMHRRVQRLRSKNFELRKAVKLLQKDLKAAKESALLPGDDISLSASMEFAE